MVIVRSDSRKLDTLLLAGCHSPDDHVILLLGTAFSRLAALRREVHATFGSAGEAARFVRKVEELEREAKRLLVSAARAARQSGH